MNCSEIDCLRKVYARNLCKFHYEFYKRNGNIDKFNRIRGNYQDGLYRSPTYNSWNSMKVRCYKKNAQNYKYYGGKGIKVCDRWLEKPNGFNNFIADLGIRPEGKTLDRINVYGDYTPDNCKWSELNEQLTNKGLPINNTSGYKGVVFDKSAKVKHWAASIGLNGKSIKIGRYLTKEEAAIQYDLYLIFFKGYGTTNIL